MLKRIVVITLALTLLAAPALAKQIPWSELMQDPAFAKASPEDRLAMLDQKVNNKELRRYDISSDIWGRMYMDAIVSVKDPMARLEKYASLKARFRKCGYSHDLERYLAIEYMIADPNMKKAGIIKRMRLLNDLYKQKRVSSSAIHSGFLAIYLILNKNYPGMSPAEKLKLLGRLHKEKVFSSITASNFAKGAAFEMMSGAPPDKQAQLFMDVTRNADFFTKNAIERGYIK